MPGCKGDKQPSSTTRGPGTVLRPGLPRGPGLICGADRWGVSSIEQGQHFVAITTDYPGLLPASQVTETEVPVPLR